MTPATIDPAIRASAHLPKRARLLAAAELVPPGSRVADIGSGHGLLPRLLLASGRATFCIATERNPERLARVRPLPTKLPLARRLELRHGDGLAVLEPADRIDVALLLGLGTRSIERILDHPRAAPLAIRRFVFQPQTEGARLRAALLDRGLAIRDERLVADRGRTYLLIAAEPDDESTLPSHADLSPEELLEVGPILARGGNPLVLEVWRAEFRRRRDVAQRATGQTRRREAHAACERARRIVVALEARRQISHLERLPALRDRTLRNRAVLGA